MITNFKSILELLNAFKDEQDCIDYLEHMRWGETVVSPFDSTSKVYKCKNNKYHCHNTKKYFNVKTGTFLDGSKVTLRKWLVAIFLITTHKKGISSVQLAKDINVTQKTAWFMAHRIRNCFGIPLETKLSGTVESDETFVGGKNKNRHKNKKVQNSQGRSFKDKTPVLGLIQRQEIEIIPRPHKILKDKTVEEKIVIKKAFVFCCVIPDTQKESIQPLIKIMVEENSRLITDEWGAYTGLNSIYTHHIVNHQAKEFVNKDDNTIHSNSIEGFWSSFKHGLIGTYHCISKRSKHLQKYANEFAFRYNNKEMSSAEIFGEMIINLEHKLPYKKLIA